MLLLGCTRVFQQLTDFFSRRKPDCISSFHVWWVKAAMIIPCRVRLVAFVNEILGFCFNLAVKSKREREERERETIYLFFTTILLLY